jgi:hypothetical protein
MYVVGRAPGEMGLQFRDYRQRDTAWASTTQVEPDRGVQTGNERKPYVFTQLFKQSLTSCWRSEQADKGDWRGGQQAQGFQVRRLLMGHHDRGIKCGEVEPLVQPWHLGLDHAFEARPTCMLEVQRPMIDYYDTPSQGGCELRDGNRVGAGTEQEHARREYEARRQHAKG